MNHGLFSVTAGLFLVFVAVGSVYGAEGRIPISERTTIQSSGSYLLTQDIDCDVLGDCACTAPSTTSGLITVDADHVTIDLDNHTIVGIAGCPVIGNINTRSDIHIKNGKIVGGDTGILLSKATGGGQYTVENLSLVSNGGIGGSIKISGVSGAGNSVRAVVKDNTVERSSSNGIRLEYVDNGVVSNNTVTLAPGAGISVNNANNCIFDHNTISANSDNGLAIEPGKNNLVQGNTSSGNGNNGIILNIATSNIVDGNTVAGNGGVGIWIHASFGGSNNNTISNNNVSVNASDGIFLDNASYNFVHHNSATDNGATGLATFRSGIHLKGNSDYNTIDGNVSAKNREWGLFIEVGSTGNAYSYNKFLTNTSGAVSAVAGNIDVLIETTSTNVIIP